MKLVTTGQIISVLNPTSTPLSFKPTQSNWNQKLQLAFPSLFSRFVNLLSIMAWPMSWPGPPGLTTDHCTGDTRPPSAHQWLIISKQSPTQNIRIFCSAASDSIVSQYFYQKFCTKSRSVTIERIRHFYRKFHLWAYFSFHSFSQMSFLPDEV